MVFKHTWALIQVTAIVSLLIYDIKEYHIQQNFHQRLILCIGTKISSIAQVTFQEVMGGAHELL